MVPSPKEDRPITKQRKSKQALQYMIAQALRDEGHKDEGHKDVIVRVYPAPGDGNWDAEVIEGDD
jgi:hypothetical protein